MLKTLIKKIILNYKFKGCKLSTIEIHPTAVLGNGVNLSKNVCIGEDVYIGDYTYVNNYSSISSAYIGSYCSIGPYCNIGPDSHPLDWFSTSPNFYRNYSYNNNSGYIEPKERPIIGNDVWIGSHVVIMRGVVIGDGAVLAAGSIITKNVLPYSIVSGVPGRHLRFRFEEEIISKLLKIDIWKDKLSELKRNEFANNKENFKDFL